ncbi:MAG: ZIP family metal transporter [candidate division KSB1 bacterium]|nr:ZIP family metal transporter [candidate division KSB1 bacterium]
MKNVLIYGSVAALAAVMGSLIPLLRQNWQKERLYWFMAFGSGVLLGAAFIHIIPEAVTFNAASAGMGLSIAFLVIFGLEQFAPAHSCPEYLEECACPVHTMGLVTFIALFIHSLIDGLAVAAGFGASLELGFIASFAVIVHKFPTGLTTIAILLGTGYGRKKSFLLTLLVAMATPIGALVSQHFVLNLSNNVLSWILGISGGSFIYVAATDILPRLHQERSIPCFLLFLGGVGLMFGSSFIGLK